MKKTDIFFAASILSIGLVVASIIKNELKPAPKISKPDQCMSCHQNTTDMDSAHPNEIFGCYKCHGGNRYATDKINAHKNMVLNPSRLEHAVIFCSECHSDVIKRVSNSMMQSQSGILNVLKYQWGESKDLNSTIGIDDIKEDINTTSLAKNHFKKACASCHINQDESVFDDPKYAKGGGCVDCHRITKGTISDENSTLKITHSTLSTKIPSKNCLKCHNRSNRIGLSYFGIFESEGYGTPYKGGDFTHKLDNSRFYYELPADVHHSKAGLDCIDCHTEAGVMGDGKKYHHMEEAEDIKCKDCHKPKFAFANSLAVTLSDLNSNIPKPKKIAYTSKKNSPYII